MNSADCIKWLVLLEGARVSSTPNEVSNCLCMHIHVSMYAV